MQKTQKIGTRPAYFDGQLLQADDFIAEQKYNRLARHRHNMALHDWGVVSGLEVHAAGEDKIIVQPGFAVDSNGREIDIPNPCPLDLGGMPARVRLRVTLHHRDDTEPERSHRNRIDSHAVLTVSDNPDDKESLLLATLQLDAAGKVDTRSIELSAVRRARTRIAPGSVDVAALSPSLRRGWLAMPFRGSALEKGPDDGTKGLPPPFRVGTSEARSHDRWEGAENTKGAGGTMAIAIPFGARRVLQFRIAGVNNDGGIDFHVVRGGFDPVAKVHSRKVLLEKAIKGRPYNELYPIEGGELDPEYNTLALWVRSHGKASVSLVAFEFSN